MTDVIAACKTDCSSSGVEQQRGEGRVHGPGGAVRVGEGPVFPSEAPAEETWTAAGGWDARLHQSENLHFHSADRHLITSVTWERERWGFFHSWTIRWDWRERWHQSKHRYRHQHHRWMWTMLEDIIYITFTLLIACWWIIFNVERWAGHYWTDWMSFLFLNQDV